MDLAQLPADLWVARLPASLRDRPPHIEERDGQAAWICDGKVWGSWVGKPPANCRGLAARGGAHQVSLSLATIEPNADDPAWETFWSLLEDTGIILSWHITVFLGRVSDRAQAKAASVFENTKFFMGNFLEPFVDLFAWGILERHPKLRIVMAEAGTGWLPWLVQELDYRHWRLWEAKEFWGDKGGIALETKASQV